MTEEEILSKLTNILRALLLDDSFNYINFIVAVEIEFGVKFKVADVESFADVGAIVTELRSISAQP